MKSARILRSSMHSIALGESVHAVIIESNLVLIAGEAARARKAAPKMECIFFVCVAGFVVKRNPCVGGRVNCAPI